MTTARPEWSPRGAGSAVGWLGPSPKERGRRLAAYAASCRLEDDRRRLFAICRFADTPQRLLEAGAARHMVDLSEDRDLIVPALVAGVDIYIVIDEATTWQATAIRALEGPQLDDEFLLVLDDATGQGSTSFARALAHRGRNVMPLLTWSPTGSESDERLLDAVDEIVVLGGWRPDQLEHLRTADVPGHAQLSRNVSSIGPEEHAALARAAIELGWAPAFVRIVQREAVRATGEALAARQPLRQVADWAALAERADSRF